MTAEAFLPQLRDYNRFEWVKDVLLTVIFVAGMGGLASFPYFLARKWRLLCPTCRKALVDRVGRAAKLTGKCPKCQSGVFSEEAHVPVNPAERSGLTKEKFEVLIAELGRKSVRQGVIFLVVLFGLMLGAGLVSRSIQTLLDQGQFDDLIPVKIIWAARAILILTTATVLAIPLFVATARVKTTGVPCPACHRPIFGRAAAAAMKMGICVHCGAPLFEIASLASH